LPIALTFGLLRQGAVRLLNRKIARVILNPVQWDWANGKTIVSDNRRYRDARIPQCDLPAQMTGASDNAVRRHQVAAL
jgi:hypothetical protein